MIIFAIFFILLGWLAGVAINHAADILPTRKTVRQAPFCHHCGQPRTQKQWSALVAWATHQANCAQCQTKQHTFTRSIIVELVVPLFFLFLLWSYGLSLTLVINTVYTVILILITVTDLEHRLIFNVVIMPAILLSIVMAFFTPGLAWPSAIVGGVGAFIVVYLAALLARGGLGEGDVTLSTFLGFILGFPLIVLSLTFGVFMGGFVAFFMLVTGRVGLKTFIPYGPFLTITGWIMLIWGEAIWEYFFF